MMQVYNSRYKSWLLARFQDTEKIENWLQALEFDILYMEPGEISRN